jgi:hypothetical protein
MTGGLMTPWDALIGRLPDLAQKVRAMQPPKLRVVADGRVLYWALAVPTEEDLEAYARFSKQRITTLEDWLVERLSAMRQDWPDVKEIELLGVWAGNPPRLERVARARVKTREVDGGAH